MVSKGYSLVVVHGLLIVLASPVAEHRLLDLPFRNIHPLGRVLGLKSYWTRLAGPSVSSCVKQLELLRVCSAQETLPRIQTKEMSVEASFVKYISYRSLGEFKGEKRLHPFNCSLSLTQIQ